jgi:hypothetical protein
MYEIREATFVELENSLKLRELKLVEERELLQ